MAAKTLHQNPEEYRQVIKLAAELIVGGHSATAQAMLEAAMLECAEHPQRSGVTSRKNWLASMFSLGEVVLSISKREKNRDDWADKY